MVEDFYALSYPWTPLHSGHQRPSLSSIRPYEGCEDFHGYNVEALNKDLIPPSKRYALDGLITL